MSQMVPMNQGLALQAASTPVAASSSNDTSLNSSDAPMTSSQVTLRRSLHQEVNQVFSPQEVTQVYQPTVVVNQMDPQISHLEAQASYALGEANQRVQNVENQAQGRFNQMAQNEAYAERVVLEAQARIQHMEMQAREAQETISQANHVMHQKLQQMETHFRERDLALHESNQLVKELRQRLAELEVENACLRSSQSQNSAVHIPLAPKASIEPVNQSPQFFRPRGQPTTSTVMPHGTGGERGEAVMPTGTGAQKVDVEWSPNALVNSIFGAGLLPVQHMPQSSQGVVDHGEFQNFTQFMYDQFTRHKSQSRPPSQGGQREPSALDPHGPSSSSSSSSDKRRPKGGGGGNGGGGSPGGSQPSSPHNSVGSSLGSPKDSYDQEKKLMRVKQHDTMKIPALPKSASDARGFRNQVYNTICKLAKGDEGPTQKWIEECCNPKANLDSSSPYPILDRVLGSKVLELSKNTKFAMLFQSHQEQEQRKGKQPKGRKLLWFVFERFKMEKDKGISLTQHHLLTLKLVGNDVAALEDFRQKFDFIFQALERSELPSDNAIRSLLYEQLKHHPRMALTIDRFRSASSSSSKRTWMWLYERLIEAIDIAQLDENSASIEKSFMNQGTLAKGAMAQGEKEKKREKPEKPKKKEKTAEKESAKRKDEDKEKTGEQKIKGHESQDAPAAPGAPKGKGKGKESAKGKDSNRKKYTAEEKKKMPCMYFGFDACSKGDQCPYMHDPNNKYKGPKPKGLSKGSSASAGAATVSAGAARILATASALKSQVAQAASASKSFRKHVSKTPVMAKCMKAVAALIACLSQPMSQEFLLDSGAGRNLMSLKDLPAFIADHAREADEPMRFATGGGIQLSGKVLDMSGETSGRKQVVTE